MNNKIRLASQEIASLAESLNKKGYNQSSELMKIAQFLDAQANQNSLTHDVSTDGQQIDPSLLSSLANLNTQEMPLNFDANNQGVEIPQTAELKEDISPKIESFVKEPEKEVINEDNRVTNTCTITFKTKDGSDLSQTDIMSAMLELGKKMNVDVDGFRWQKSDKKS